MEIHIPSSEELRKAHALFQQKEPRWRDYEQAIEGANSGFHDGNLNDVATSVAALLRSWNRDFYRFKPAKVTVLQTELQQLITEYLQTIAAFRSRSLASMAKADRQAVLSLFASFEQKLGPVGTAKALNVLAPNFFPLWDNAISYEYGVSIGPRGYFLFMVVVKYQVASMTVPNGLAPLKVLDEYNYCKFTKQWLV